MVRKLHIGGIQPKEGWEILNAISSDVVDHVGNAKDLSKFEDNSFVEIYASHILEHLDFKDEIIQALSEWYRVLYPGGKLYVSVPDLDVLAKLYLDKENYTPDDRFFIMRMMFGGHCDQYDYHVTGLNTELLASYLRHCGFSNLKKTSNFGLFDDTSTAEFKGVPISTNIIANKPIETNK